MRVTSHATKQATVNAAIRLLEIAGCTVTVRRPDSTRALLDVAIPADSPDPHGQRLHDAQTT